MKEKLQVMKFGGTSVGNAECIQRAAEIIASSASDSEVVAVVSAMSGVTNRLIEAAHQSETGDAKAADELATLLRKQHSEAIETIVRDPSTRAELTSETGRIIEEMASLCRGTSLLHELTPRALDSIASAGERLSARLLAAALVELGVPGVAVEATEVIVTD